MLIEKNLIIGEIWKNKVKKPKWLAHPNNITLANQQGIQKYIEYLAACEVKKGIVLIDGEEKRSAGSARASNRWPGTSRVGRASTACPAPPSHGAAPTPSAAPTGAPSPTRSAGCVVTSVRPPSLLPSGRSSKPDGLNP